MGFTYQELKRIKKKSIVLEKQENIEIQQNSSSFRQRKSSLIRERFYQQPEEQTKAKETKSNQDLCQQSDSISKILLHSLVLENQQQQELVEKVHDTSQQLSNLEESINHEIKKLQQQRSRLLEGGNKMDRKKTKKQRCPSNKQATWSEHLAGNSCKERNQEPLEIAKERFSLQHQCVCTSPRYGSDIDLQPRPRMRSVASQIVTKDERLEQGAAGDHNSVIYIKENNEKDFPEIYPNIATQNDQIVNCCYGLTCQPVCQKTDITAAATNGMVCQRHNYQRTGIVPNSEYNYCRDEYYYELANCPCNTQCRTCSNNVAATREYRRHCTDLNTQHFYCRPQDRTCSPAPITKTKSKKKAKACKTKESHEEYNEGIKRECEERVRQLKQQRSKSINAHEQRASKIGRLCQLLDEESGSKVIKYLDRYVDDCGKEFSFKNIKNGASDDSSTPTTVKVKSQTKLCQVTVRKKQDTNKNSQAFKECCDNVSLDTQYSLETLRMLKKMTIREYKPVKPKDKKADNDLDDKQLDKVKRYREYLDKYEREQEAKKSIQFFKDFYKPAQKSKESLDLRRETQTSSEQLQELGDYSVIDKTNMGHVPTDSSKTFAESPSYEELRYEYGAARRGMEGWDDYAKYREPEKSRYAKQEDTEIYKKSRDRERKTEDQRSRTASKQEDTANYRKSKDRKQKAEDQGSRTAIEQEHTDIYRKSRDRERKSEDQKGERYYGDKRRYSQETKQHTIEQLSKNDFKGVKRESEYAEKSLGKERKSEDQRSRPAAIQEDIEVYRKSRDREGKAEDQGSRYYEDNIRDFKEPKQHPTENLNKQDLREAVAKAEYEDETFRDSRENEHKYNDQGSRYYKDKRRQYPSELPNKRGYQADYDKENFRESRAKVLKPRNKQGSRYYEDNRDILEEKQYPSELLNNREYKADYDEETFRESEEKIPKSRDKYYEGNKRDLEEYRPQFKQPSEINYDFKDKRNADYESESYGASEERKQQSYEFPDSHNNKRTADYESKSYREPQHGQLKPEHHYRETNRYSEEMRQSLAQQPRYSGNLKDLNAETITKVQTEFYRESKEREPKPRLQAEINEKRKIENYREELDEQPKDLEEIETKPGYYQETYKRQKRSLAPKSSLLKEAQNYDTKQESPRFSASFVTNKEPSPSQVYPLRQEDQKSETLSIQNECLYKEEPANMDFNEIEKKSNSSSYNDFKQVIDYNLGFYTSRASQTDYQFKPEVNEQQSTLTFTRGKETLDNSKDQEILSSNNQEELQEGQQLKEIPTDPSSLSPTTTKDALSYLKNFLKTCHRSGLEGECLDAVTSAANDLITKLSSCKSFIQTESLIKSNLESIDTLEKKVTQDIQYKDPESTTDSSENQLNQKKEEQDSYLETLKTVNKKEIGLQELEAKEEPTTFSLQQESYHYQSRPIEQQHTETLETYQKYVECEESMPSLEPAKEFTNKQESLQVREYNKLALLPDNSQYLEMDAKLPLSCKQKYYESAADGECNYRPLPSPSRQLPFDPELMPLKGILKPCRVMESPQMACYDLETYRTTSVVSFGQKDHINIESASSMTYKLGQEEIAQQCNETQQTIITKDEFLQPITKQSKYQLCESTSSKQPMYQDCQQESDLVTEAYSFNNSPHLYTVEMPTFKQCPCMLNMYKKMMDNYYKGRKK